MVLTGIQQVNKFREEGKSDSEIIQELISLYDISLDLNSQLMSQQIMGILNDPKLIENALKDYMNGK